MVDRFGCKGELAFPADTARSDDTRPFKHAKVFGDALPAQAEAVRQLGD